MCNGSENYCNMGNFEQILQMFTFLTCRTYFFTDILDLPVHAGSAIKVLVAIHYSVLDARNGYIRNVVV